MIFRAFLWNKKTHSSLFNSCNVWKLPVRKKKKQTRTMTIKCVGFPCKRFFKHWNNCGWTEPSLKEIHEFCFSMKMSLGADSGGSHELSWHFYAVWWIAVKAVSIENNVYNLTIIIIFTIYSPYSPNNNVKISLLFRKFGECNRHNLCGLHDWRT